MEDPSGLTGKEDAKREVELVSRRVALLLLAFAKTLVDELGTNVGVPLIAKAIKQYGRMIGEEVRKKVIGQGLPLSPENYGAETSRSLPKTIVHDQMEEITVGGKRRIRLYGCVLAKVWRQYRQEKLRRLYCYVDPAKYMAHNPEYKLDHAKALRDGHDYCELCIEKTNLEERNAFAADSEDWLSIDHCSGK